MVETMAESMVATKGDWMVESSVHSKVGQWVEWMAGLKVAQ